MADAMDSKSISREGVGVQVPASAPSSSDAALARLLLPALLHRLNNVTQVISGVNSLVRITGERGVIAEHAEDLDESARGLERLGWLLGLLGRQRGTDLLLARREPRGPEWLLDLAREALRRERRDLAAPDPGSLAIATEAPGAMDLAWTITAWLVAAAQAAPERECLTWGIRACGASVHVAAARAPAEAAALVRSLAQRVPTAGLAEEPDGRVALVLPAEGFRPPALS